MVEEKKMLALLQITVPPDTPLMVNSEIHILEILGIVSNPELIRSMDMVSSLIPANTPATLHGLVSLLGNLVKKHPKASKVHHEKLSKVLADFTDVPDSPLTYGSFLPICESIMNGKAVA